MAELVGKLKAVLGPVSALCGQANRNTTARCAVEIGLRMIGPMINVDAGKLSLRAITPKFECHRLKERCDIFRAGRSKPAGLYTDIKLARTIGCSQRAVGQEQKASENGKINEYAGVQHEEGK